jgi:cytochrome c5
MSKLFHSAAPVALTLAASLFCSAAHAAQQDAAASQPQVTLAQRAPADPAVQQPHGLTRKQVYDQLVREEKDGSLARLDATVYEGS